MSDLGVSATATELNYVRGLTGNIQTQLNKKLEAPGITSISSSNGTMNLEDNRIYRVETDMYDITFVLPTITDYSKFHQILVQFYMFDVCGVNLGTTYFFDKTAPDLSKRGYYDIIYEYDNAGRFWVCGVMSKGTV